MQLHAFPVNALASDAPIAVLVPGLNNSTSLFRDLAPALAERGVRPLVADPAPIDPRAWEEALREAYRALATVHPAAKRVVLVSFSMGALATLSVAVEGGFGSSPLVLLSPPLDVGRFRFGLHAAKLTSFLGASVPGFTPKEVRARPRTPIACFAELQRKRERLEALPPEAFAGLDVTVVLDRRDELVSKPGVLAWMSRHGVAWPVLTMDRESPPLRYHHLTPLSAGSNDPAWTAMIERIAARASENGPD